MCVVNPTQTHDSNNLILIVTPQPKDSTMRVQAHCTSPSCSKSPHALLGNLELDDLCRWTFVKRRVQPASGASLGSE